MSAKGQEWTPVILALFGAILTLAVGTALVAPTGPGSSRPVFVLLGAYSLVTVAAMPKRFWWISAIVFCGCVLGVLYTTAESRRFQNGLHRRMKQMRSDDSDP